MPGCLYVFARTHHDRITVDKLNDTVSLFCFNGNYINGFHSSFRTNRNQIRLFLFSLLRLHSLAALDDVDDPSLTKDIEEGERSNYVRRVASSLTSPCDRGTGFSSLKKWSHGLCLGMPTFLSKHDLTLIIDCLRSRFGATQHIALRLQEICDTSDNFILLAALNVSYISQIGLH